MIETLSGKKTLNGKVWLRPRDIAKAGLIKNSTGNDSEGSNYFFILKLIKSGQLKAKNYGTKSRAYWLVSEDEIKRYHEQ